MLGTIFFRETCIRNHYKYFSATVNKKELIGMKFQDCYLFTCIIFNLEVSRIMFVLTFPYKFNLFILRMERDSANTTPFDEPIVHPPDNE